MKKLLKDILSTWVKVWWVKSIERQHRKGIKFSIAATRQEHIVKVLITKYQERYPKSEGCENEVS
jgi:hypothetical protein